MAEQRTARLYASDGAAKGEVGLASEIFGIEPNMSVMHQVVTAQRAAARSGTASTKTRNEVRGGGRKPWRQKHLGRARHGSIRSPQWVGGGVVFGPKPRDYSQRTPRKMKRLALRSALSARAAEGNVVVIDRFEWAAPKTKQATALLDAVGVAGKVLVIVGPAEGVVERSFRNLPQAIVCRLSQVTTYDVLWSDTVVISADTLPAFDRPSYDVSEDDFVQEQGEES